VLNQWLLSLFNVGRFEDLAEHLRSESLEGLDENNIHHFYHALTAQLFNLTQLPTLKKTARGRCSALRSGKPKSSGQGECRARMFGVWCAGARPTPALRRRIESQALKNKP
jgi:hypothetical protein